MSEVYMKYSDFLNSIADEVTFELLTDIVLKLKYNFITSPFPFLLPTPPAYISSLAFSNS